MLFLTAMLCIATRTYVISVEDDGVGANDGSSCIDAFSDLQDAIAMAQAGDEIRMAQSIYTPTENPLDREATFELKDDMTIIGGYAGLVGMYPNFRYTEFFTTMLSGDIDHNDDGIDPNNKEGNSRHVLMCAGQDNSAILEGVTITGGFSEGTGIHVDTGAGGGLYCCRGSSP